LVDVKKRKVSSKDWDKLEKHIKDVHEARKTSSYRKHHETIWKEVDRQVSMRPMKKMLANKQEAPPSWESAIELGELAEASEIIADDVMRIQFPADKSWFAPHVELDWPMDPRTGKKKTDDEKQNIADGLLRSLMSQQQKDFGLKASYELSVKEALHHGSFVAEVRFDRRMMVRDGDKVRTLGAPVWVPYSMWNSYPDPSPSVIGTSLFYTGSMILVEFMPLYRLKQMKGEGWISERLKLVNKQTNKNHDDDTEDVELVKYKGDISIERGDGDIFLPNSEVILANGKLVYYSDNKLPYPNVIFGGYERQDVRDPYYTSPIIKQSPTHKMTSIMANRFIDAVNLRTIPPIEYDSNDPEYAQSGGPVIAPGAKTATRSMGAGFKSLEVGDPKAALDALIMGKQEMKEGLGVSSNRTGVRDADRETATAANLANQGAEVRTMGFINHLEAQGLLPFLYMQHELNRMEMTEYTFYNNEMHTPDFIRATKDDIQANAHFEVVGSRGILGEQQRAKRLAETTAFLSSNPLFAPKLKVTDIMLDMYRDAGKKDPESFVKVDDGKPEVPPQIQQALQQMQQVIGQLTEENKGLKSKHEEAMAKLQVDMRQFAATLQNDKHEFAETLQKDKQEFAAEMALKLAEFKAESKLNRQNLVLDMTGKSIDFEKMLNDKDNTQAVKGEIKSTMDDTEKRIIAQVDQMIQNAKKGTKRKVVTLRGKKIPVEISDE
jgi:hypothetical protein